MFRCASAELFFSCCDSASAAGNDLGATIK
jgi:hypothetical protein